MLQCLAIAGFRSYPQEHLQKIQFQTPLTLIWGKNGSGKTTIIEALRYIIAGVLPRSSKTGKFFISNFNLHELYAVKGDARLKFKTSQGHPILARRQALLRQCKNIVKVQFMSPTIKTLNEQGKLIQVNPTSNQMDNIILQLLGTSKSIIEHVLLCRHEEFMWPFFDPCIVKNTFQELFQAKKYYQIQQAFIEKKEEYLREINNMNEQLKYLKRLYQHDKKKKLAALREMQRISQQSETLAKSNPQLLTVKIESDTTSHMEIKNAMINKCTNFIIQGKMNLQQLSEQYLEEFGTNISKEGSIEQIQFEIEVFQKQRKRLQIRLQENPPQIVKKQGLTLKINSQSQQQLASVVKEIKRLTMQRDYYKLNKKCILSQQDMQQLLKQLSQLYQVEPQNAKPQEKLLQKSARAKFEQKKRQIDLRAQIAFQEYYRPAEKLYLIKKTEQTVKKAAVKDIQNFCLLIQNSRKELQTRMLEDANEFLSQIWSKVYNGSDIKTIRIDVNFQDQIQKRTKYEVFVESTENTPLGGKKINMRDFCSLGQKVLASILIRIALAKIFSPKNCIFALDDPTAHLDRENVANLAECLKRMLQLNEFQSLQLILISQDLQFIELFGNYCENYYEVSRNEKNCSIIRKKQMRQYQQQG